MIDADVFRYQARPHPSTRLLVERAKMLKEGRADRLTPVPKTSSESFQ